MYGIDILQGEKTVSAGSSRLIDAARWLTYAAAFLLPLWFFPFTADVLEFGKQILLSLS